MKKPIQTVLFDLDGTLLDTAPDLAFALNTVLSEQKREPLPLEQIRPWVSHGGNTLIKNGFQLSEQDPAIKSLRKRFLDIYLDHIADHTRLFEGMPEVLETLESGGIQWGVVTNKPTYLTTPLLQQLGLTSRSVCNISGDTLPQCKPDPAPLLHACELAQTIPAHCIYVGDAPRDIEAGRRAGMRTLVALYGYIETFEHPTQWGATGMIQKPLDLLSWISSST
ncbi:MAG: phosphoglycolate phosphatase [Gammaproteobacteria bacterium]|nr:MAG: phosphoglycolate phosphatase [Gammaproteobacteria bacterium]RKZ43362.1 MAG: phosphoglycolate phosphatase [Gammaproteobacteria bacterium]RKZ74433.1 MAG: phosphoglycolate phosphatase [Gammaproteobacteria bacterium]